MKDIVIIGAGGFGREVLWLIQEINKAKEEWNICGFIDDSVPVDEEVNGFKNLGKLDWLKNKEINVVCAIGDPLVKKRILKQLLNANIHYPALIHPSVIMSESAIVGEGAIICAGSIITTNITIGDHVIINLDCTVGHDTIIGNYSTINPSVNVSGCVIIKDCVTVGTGVKIIQGVTIERNSIIGAGAVVTKNISRDVVAIGMPAKAIKRREQ